jgi:hypothetical protein
MDDGDRSYAFSNRALMSNSLGSTDTLAPTTALRARRRFNYEAFFRRHPCWVDDRCGGLNVGVGISVSGPQL